MAETKSTPPTNYQQAPPSPPYSSANYLYSKPHDGGSGSVSTQGPLSSSQQMPVQGPPPPLQQVPLQGPPYPLHHQFVGPPPAGVPVFPGQPIPVPVQEQGSFPREKNVAGVVVALVSLVIIALAYVSFISTGRLERTPIGPLAAGVVFLVINISVGIWLCTDFTAPRSVQGLVPVGFGVVACITFVIYYASWVSFVKNGFGWNINNGVVLASSLAFAGMAFGNAFGYVIFGNTPRHAG